jgi:MoaA/NifB/PqqE/SkfB family radical SAM enzyme
MTLAGWQHVLSPRLRLLALAVADRCDQRCVHCQIWQAAAADRTLTLDERLAVVDDAIASGIEEALLTGGEPLASADLWPVARRLRDAGVRLMLATNGMRLAAHAPLVADLFDEVYVSLDGAEPSTHDRLRGVPAFARVAAGVAALRTRRPRPRLVARSALHGGNLAELSGIVAAARRMGFDHVSFLALDASTRAFGGEPGSRRALLPTAGQVAEFEAGVARLERRGVLADGFVLESAAKLRRLARHLDASAGRLAFTRPECDAPWWSLVVEADGAVRPCFFHEAVGDARVGLGRVRFSAAYRSALDAIRGPNATCETCVCPKRRGGGH